ncbi:GPI alpha-1,2-mannosyltransferase 4-like [Glandiceps talaboti]
MDKVWRLLILVRFITTLLPQRGYIHPDEFFQNPEITAESVLGFDVYKSWEWTSKELSLRNVLFPYATSGTAFMILQMLQNIIPGMIDAYTLLIFPRLMMVVLSLTLDLLMYKMCQYLRINDGTSLALLSTSYAILVFCCRTFSNAVECILFALVMFLVLKSSSLIDKPKTKKLKNSSQEKTYALLLSIVITYGFFLRLSFAAFVAWPMFYWYLSIVHSRGFVKGIMSAASLIPGVIFTSFLYISIDSVYFGSLNLSPLSLVNLVQTFSSVEIFDNLTVTPFNFLRYNTDVTKLSEQTLHPHITHLILNMPLLFLPLLIWGVPAIITSLRNLPETKKLASIDKTNLFLIFSVVVPVGILSLIPHQEARFIIPIIVPLILLFCKNVKEFSDNFKVSWIVWNFIGFMFFGMFHQGGVLPSMQRLHDISKYNPQTMYHFVFFHTYMPPRHLLAINKSWDSHVTGSSANQDDRFHQVTVHDLAGADFSTLDQKIERLSKYAEFMNQKDFEDDDDKCIIYIISPSPLHQFFCIHDNYDFILEEQFYFHLGLDDGVGIPRDDVCTVGENDHEFMKFIKNEMSLNLYRLSTSTSV